MSDLTLEKIGMPLTDWQRRWSQDGPFELIEGEIVAVSPEKLHHMILSKKIFKALFDLELAGLAQVFTEGTFAQLEGSDWVTGSRIPDVMFYTQVRWDKYLAETPNAVDKPLVLYPDLVVEVISPNDSYTAVNRKVRVYLADGVQVVWLVDPRTRTIDVWRNDGTYRQLGQSDTLIDPILPGFSLLITDFFDQ